MEVEFRSFNGAEDWAWFNKHNPIKRNADTTGIMAVDTGKKETVASMIMDNWTTNSVQCHIVITDPLVLRHKFLECVANFLFIEKGLGVLYGFIPSTNAKSIRIAEHAGFTLKVRLEEAYAVGVDYLLMELKRKNCRFIDKAARDGHFRR